MRPEQFLDRVFYQNSVRQWAVAFAIALVAFLALLLVRFLLVGRLGTTARRTTTELDDILVEIVARTRPYFLAAVAIVVGSRFLILPSTTDRYFDAAFALVLLVQCGLWGGTAVDLWIHRRADFRATHADAASITTMRALGIAAKLVLWTIIFITALDKFGVNVTTLVTGLGIGGVAIALAVQNVLGDLFAALAIVFDKPFDVGDAIAVDQMSGTVERIGLKTTRIRSTSGEQIIISNSELLKSRIRNYKRQLDRRVVFTTDVTYDTKPDVVARIPAMIREVVTAQNPVRFDRSHFTQYLDSALRIETVYYVLDADYGRYLDIQQTINLELLRRFAAEEIQFAFPTRTIALEPEALKSLTADRRTQATQSSERIQPPSTAID
ncbi:MAG TPA: mechanosensitive ion channel family protein [Casimicrobiaceae bacterium]|jgi:small-conductance mechanosensitive channel|nr:mechanosensitive ion channel family protein [Casimicrobiaceae bacterium]